MLHPYIVSSLRTILSHTCTDWYALLQSNSSKLCLDLELHLSLPLSVVLRIISVEHDLLLGLGLGRLRLHVAHLGLEQLSGPTSGR